MKKLYLRLLYKLGTISKRYRLVCYKKTKSAPWGVRQMIFDSGNDNAVIIEEGCCNLTKDDFSGFYNDLILNKK